MKRKYFNLALLGFMLTSGLASCSGDNGQVDEEKLSGISKQDAMRCLTQLIPEVEKQDLGSVSYEKRNFTKDYIVSNYLEYSLALTEGSAGLYGLYSLRDNKYIISPSLQLNKGTRYSLKHFHNGDIYFIEIHTSNYGQPVSLLYDNCANLIINSLDNENFNIQQLNSSQEACFQINDQYLVYKDKKPYLVDSLSDDTSNSSNEDYSDFVSYGHLYKKPTGLYIYNDGSKIYSFTIPQYSQTVFLKDKIYYQLINTLNEEAEDYDFYDRGSKVNYQTKCIDLKKQSTYDVETDYVIYGNNSQNKIVDNDKSIVRLARVNNLKALDESSSYLINSDFDVLYRYNALNPYNLTKVCSNYYDSNSQILYDSNLNIISYLSSLQPRYLPYAGAFVGRYNGKYGMFNTSGDIVLDFEYDDICSSVYGSYVIAKQNNTSTIYSFDSMDTYPTEYTSTERQIYEINEEYGLYCYTDRYNNQTLFSLSSGKVSGIIDFPIAQSMSFRLYKEANMNTRFILDDNNIKHIIEFDQGASLISKEIRF